MCKLPFEKARFWRQQNTTYLDRWRGSFKNGTKIRVIYAFDDSNDEREKAIKYFSHIRVFYGHIIMQCDDSSLPSLLVMNSSRIAIAYRYHYRRQSVCSIAWRKIEKRSCEEKLFVLRIINRLKHHYAVFNAVISSDEINWKRAFHALRVQWEVDFHFDFLDVNRRKRFAWKLN